MIELPLALIGAKGLYALYIWLGSAIITSAISNRKGYTERIGLAMALVLPVIAVIVWLFVPAREGSRWKVEGPFPKRHRAKDVPIPSHSGAGPSST